MIRARAMRVLGLLACLLFFVAVMLVGAQEEAPDAPPFSERPSKGQMGAPPVVSLEIQADGRGKEARRAAAGESIAAPSSGGAPLGTPGFSLRSIGSEGVSTVGYFEDSDHLNYPFAVGTTPDNVWIGDTTGERALQFTPAGTFVSQVGQAGYLHGLEGATLATVAEVAQDASGNVWLADTNADHVVEVNSSGDVVNDLGTTWETGTDNDHFSAPRGIAFDSSGNVYIADNGNERIQIFDGTLTYLATIGESGVAGTDNSHFYCPNHIAIDSNDLLYVPDTCNARVQVFDVSTPTSATYVATMGVTAESGSDNDHFSSPIGVAVNDSLIYVADFRNHRVQVFDHDSRGYLATIGTGSAGSGNDSFNLPSDVAIDSSGNLYVADQLNFRVQEFDSSHAYVRTYGTTGVPYLTDGAHFNGPGGLAFAADGSLYLVELAGDRLVKLDAGGNDLWTVGEPGVEGSDNAHFISPNDVDIDSSGNAYVVDTWNYRIQEFSSSGSYIDTLGGTSGTGDYEFDGPQGVAVAPDGRIYVADTYNHRIQVYSSSLVYQTTIGVTGVEGSDNSHLRAPWDVDVDTSGNVFIVDHGNHRIQVFDSSGTYLRTIGESGVEGVDYGHLSNPTSVTVDSSGRTYVGDQWGGRIQVFDPVGAYLTTVNWLDSVDGLAISPQGDPYAALSYDQSVQIYTPGVPGWVQSNLNGFGNPNNANVLAVEPFGSDLFAGTGNFSTGAEIWELSSGNWSSAMTGGFGHAYNGGIDDLEVFGADLYASTWADDTNGGEIYRSSDGTTWNPVVTGGFGDATNAEVFGMVPFSGNLYASTWSYTSSHGTELWRSASGDPGSWSNVVSNGFGDSGNYGITAMGEYGGQLYAGTSAGGSGGEVWRSASGDAGSWSQVNSAVPAPGQDGDNISSMASFNGALYLSTVGSSTLHGSEVWRCVDCDGTDWEQVLPDGGGDSDNHGNNGLIAHKSTLFLWTRNDTTGAQIWSTSNGDSGSWHKSPYDGLGDV